MKLDPSVSSSLTSSSLYSSSQGKLKVSSDAKSKFRTVSGKPNSLSISQCFSLYSSIPTSLLGRRIRYLPLGCSSAASAALSLLTIACTHISASMAGSSASLFATLLGLLLEGNSLALSFGLSTFFLHHFYRVYEHREFRHWQRFVWVWAMASC